MTERLSWSVSQYAEANGLKPNAVYNRLVRGQLNAGRLWPNGEVRIFAPGVQPPIAYIPTSFSRTKGDVDERASAERGQGTATPRSTPTAIPDGTDSPLGHSRERVSHPKKEAM